MEILGGIALALAALVLLASVGVVTLAAFALMGALGLLTDWSFKRVFVVSFALGLLAPFLLGGAIIGAIEDGSLQRDFQDALVIEADADDLQEIRDLLPPPEELERLLEERPDIRERIPPEVMERLLERGIVIDQSIEPEGTISELPDESSE